MKDKFYSIELLRFFSSIAVILYHYKIGFAWDKGFVGPEILGEILPYYEKLNLLYNYGFYGVQLFFLISGFVFAHIYINKIDLTDAKEFFINRFARLYPLHFFTLLIIVIYFFIDQEFINSQFNEERSRFIDFYHFILNIFYIHSWGLEKGLSFNAPTWSVSVEIAVYVTFYLSLRFLRKYKIYFSLFITFLLFVLYKIPFFDFRYNEYIFLFYLGVTIYQLPIKRYFKLFLFFSVLMILAAFVGRNFKVLLFCPGILISFLVLDIFLKNLQLKKIFSILGGTTYSLYLLHYPLMIVFLWMENKNIINENFYSNNSFILIYFITLIIVSICSYKYLEKPLNKKIRNLYKR